MNFLLSHLFSYPLWFTHQTRVQFRQRERDGGGEASAMCASKRIAAARFRRKFAENWSKFESVSPFFHVLSWHDFSAPWKLNKYFFDEYFSEFAPRIPFSHQSLNANALGGMRKVVRIVVVGSKRVGKTAFLQQLAKYQDITSQVYFFIHRSKKFSLYDFWFLLFFIGLSLNYNCLK